MIEFWRFYQQKRDLRDFIPLITLLPKSQVFGKERDDFRGFISALRVLADLIGHGLGLIQTQNWASKIMGLEKF